MSAYPADPMGMPSDPKAKHELLALCGVESRVGGLVSELSARGLRVDQVRSLEELRMACFQRGGHEYLILAPELSPNLACAAVETLRAIDPGLPLIVFGESLARQKWTAPVTRLSSYHPSSRAGLGAVLRTILG
ncbi:MAG: hypothetical protein ACYTG5_15980 [Planctomycetota bacterium]|jgi:hypothetical protein